MIRIGIIGCGRILAAHLRGYRLLREAGVDDFRITALCARREQDAWMYVRRGEGPPQREPVSSAPGDPLSVGDIYLSDFQGDVPVEVYTDYRQMIAAGPVDAVNDFTAHALHHRIAEVAFDYQKHLLTQKPLAVSVQAGRRMCELAEARQLVLGVFENARNRPDTRQLRWLFDSDLCGRLQMILLTNVGNWWAPDRVVAGTPWRHRFREGGGITLDIGVHLFHHIRYVAGEILRVTGHTSVLEPVRSIRNRQGQQIQRIDCDADDTMLAQCETERGVIANVCASWSGHGQGTVTGPGRAMVYYASAGCVKGDYLVTDDGRSRSVSEMYGGESAEHDRQRHFPLGLQDAFALNQLDWLEAIRQRRQPETSGREGLRDLAVAFAVLESSHAGRTVEVEEVLSGRLYEVQKKIAAPSAL